VDLSNFIVSSDTWDSYLRDYTPVTWSAVAGTMIYMPLIRFPARVQEDGEVMEHFPS
jgi:hypothetical protein